MGLVRAHPALFVLGMCLFYLVRQEPWTHEPD